MLATSFSQFWNVPKVPQTLHICPKPSLSPSLHYSYICSFSSIPISGNAITLLPVTQDSFAFSFTLQVLLILLPIYLLCPPLFLHAHCHSPSQVSITSHLDDLISNLSGFPGYSTSGFSTFWRLQLKWSFQNTKLILCLTLFWGLLR